MLTTCAACAVWLVCTWFVDADADAASMPREVAAA
jgi:hypothetical protein